MTSGYFIFMKVYTSLCDFILFIYLLPLGVILFLTIWLKTFCPDFLIVHFCVSSSIILAIIFFFWMVIVPFVELMSYFNHSFGNTTLKTDVIFHWCLSHEL